MTKISTRTGRTVKSVDDYDYLRHVVTVPPHLHAKFSSPWNVLNAAMRYEFMIRAIDVNNLFTVKEMAQLRICLAALPIDRPEFTVGVLQHTAETGGASNQLVAKLLKLSALELFALVNVLEDDGIVRAPGKWGRQQKPKPGKA